MEKILNLANKEEEKILRNETREFDFDAHAKEEVDELIAKMRKVMDKANGIGLAANQIGLDIKVFVAQWEGKFYAVFNPVIDKVSEEEVIYEEGCLSIPGKYGEVARPEKITLKGQNKRGKKIKIKAWGWLARIFQHEVDHLNGKLYVDRMDKGSELREREK